MRDTPLIFWRLYRYYRHTQGRRASLKKAWRCIQHRIE